MASFAFAITLLVLGFVLPQFGNQPATEARVTGRSSLKSARRYARRLCVPRRLGDLSARLLVALVVPKVSFGLYVLVTLFYLIPRGADTDLASSAN